jgi:hypothetical protein
MIAQTIARRIRLSLIAGGALLLVGCGGNTPPATTEAPPVADLVTTSEVTTEPTFAGPTVDLQITAPPEGATQPPFPTIRPTFEGEIIALDSRTLVASRTEDPNAGMPFTSIRIERNGSNSSFGLMTPNPPLIIDIQGNGQVTFGDLQGQIPQQTLDQMNERIRTIDFFGISGDFIGVLPLEGLEEYIYKVTIIRGDLTRSIDARDSVMPQELRDFIAYLFQTAQQSANESAEPAEPAAATPEVTAAS